MNFDDKVEQIADSYLTQEMQGSVKMKFSGGGNNKGQNPVSGNSLNPNPQTTSNTGAPTSNGDAPEVDFADLMSRMTDAPDDDEGINGELGQYFTNLGIDLEDPIVKGNLGKFFGGGNL
jgi:hypothetical protein|tara:strand:- start:6432 stop:6788 length:357 start_codon:yes stop_codon:yes gene_type:complete